ncbi:MAG: preprotein translocase subunit Sec61beta [Candidatus Njordarchaeia archaeon]
MSYDDEEEEYTGKRKPREKGIRTPPTGAGLLRFYDEEEGGLVKVGPGAVIILSTLFVLIVILAWLRSLGRLPF